MADVALECQCGTVKGVARNITPATGNRVVCCCDDCQRFAQWLQRENDVLDKFGGTDIYQTSQSQVTITQGEDQLRSMRLAKKGLLRWYTGCCNTPVANTMNASMPFAGIIHNFMKLNDRDSALGAVRAYVQTRHARGEPDYPHSAQKFPLGITLRIMRKMLVWKLRGWSRPSVFFDESGRPVSKPEIATAAE